MKKELLKYYIPYVDSISEFTNVKDMINNHVYYTDDNKHNMVRYYKNQKIKIKGNIYDSVFLKKEIYKLYEKIYIRFILEKHYDKSYKKFLLHNVSRDLTFYVIKIYTDISFREFVRFYLHVLS